MDDPEGGRYIKALVKRYGPNEHPLVDYKASFDALDGSLRAKLKLCKHIAAMANSAKYRDAVLVYGVDNTGEIVGVSESQYEKFDDACLQDIIKAAIDPVPRVRGTRHIVDGARVIMVRVVATQRIHVIAKHLVSKEGKHPFRLHQGQVYIRRGTASVPAQSAELMSLVGRTTEAAVVVERLQQAAGLERLLERLLRLTLTRRLHWTVEENNARWRSIEKDYEKSEGEWEPKAFYLAKWPWDEAGNHPHPLPRVVLNEAVGANTLVDVEPIPRDAVSILGQSRLYQLAVALCEAVADLSESPLTEPEVMATGVADRIYNSSKHLREIEELLDQIEENEWW